MRLVRSKYRVVPYTIGKSAYAYGIAKRFLYFFYRRLIHYKIVQWDGGSSIPSRELLSFPTLDEAAAEIAKLTRGEGQIAERYWQAGGKAGLFSGKLVRTIRVRS